MIDLVTRQIALAIAHINCLLFSITLQLLRYLLACFANRFGFGFREIGTGLSAPFRVSQAFRRRGGIITEPLP